jgi:hypothetical protein
MYATCIQSPGMIVLSGPLVSFFDHIYLSRMTGSAIVFDNAMESSLSQQSYLTKSGPFVGIVPKDSV